MKKLFFLMAAAAALFTSCSKDDTIGGLSRGKVTFEVSAPELATRYGEGTTATTLQYAVYDMVENTTEGTLVDTGSATLNNKAANVAIDLVEGRTYSVIFWADAGTDSPYTFTPATKTVSYKNTSDLKANQESYDAFFAYVPKEQVKVGETVTVELKRPFAQLRIETSDKERAAKLGVNVEKTGITVNAYTSFNLVTGVVADKQELTFEPTTAASATTTVDGTTYDLISMNYLLVNNKEAVDVTLNFTDKISDTQEETYVRKYNAINIQRNYRTLVRGTILTDPTNFDVTVQEGFDGDYTADGNNSATQVVSTAQELSAAFEALNDNDPSNDPGTIVLGGDINLGNGSLTIGDTSSTNAKAQNSLSTRTETAENPTIYINGNNKTITSSARRVIEIKSSNINVIIKDLNIDSEAVRTGTDDIRGINITPNLSNVGLTLDNCTVKFSDDSASDWAYAINQTGGNTNNTITINGGEYNGANTISIWGSNNTINIDGAKLTSLYGDNDIYYGGCVVLNANDNNTSTGNVVSIKNTEFNGSNAVAAEDSGDNTITMENCTDNCNTNIVWQVGGDGQAKIAKAIENGWNFKLIGNMKVANQLKIAKDITIDLDGHTISGVNNTGSGSLINVANGASLTIKDSSTDKSGKITYANGSSNVGWAIHLEGQLNLESGTIELTGDWAIAYAVDVRPNSWGDEYKTATVFNMTGGKLVSSLDAVRVASTSADGSSNNTTYSNVSATFKMTGGEIEAVKDGVFFQQSNTYYDNLNLEISAGTINANKYPVRIYAPVATSKVGDSSLKISGGTFKKVDDAADKTPLVSGLLYLGGGVTAETLYHTNIEISGGSFADGEVLTPYTMTAQTPASDSETVKE